MKKFLMSDAYDGIRRKLFRIKCTTCKKAIYRPKHTIGKRNYCSKKCKAKKEEKRKNCKCFWCRKSFKRALSKTKTKHGYNFCSRKCKEIAQGIEGIKAFQLKHYKDGKYVYRKRALRYYGKKCSKCGYDKYEEMLDVDHKDGNRKNNKIKNLEVLCVWCHALKTRKIKYHSINRG